jgi:tRNA(fMet)-specific endonuclease VapC
MIRYLLDADTLSDLVRHEHGRVAQRLFLVGEEAAATSIIAASELRFSAERRGSERLQRRVDGLLKRMTVLSYDEPADIAYARLRVGLEQRGALIGGNDLLVAAQALALGLILVTHNTREFARIPSLKVEDWLA